MMKSKKGITAVEVIVIIVIIAILAVIGFGTIAGLLNEQNRITEGVIVDKSYTEERITTIPYTHREPAHCYFQLEGEKNEIKVKYWLGVSEHDYNTYKIGDYYKL